LSFAEAMRRYADLTQDRRGHPQLAAGRSDGEASRWHQDQQAYAQRYVVLQRRRQEDAAWREARQTHRHLREARRALSRAERAAQRPQWQAHLAEWAQRKQARRTLLADRQAENQRWHAANQHRRQEIPSVWIAILVVTDNATRQCLGLPVFASGAHVTAQEVADALRGLLPADLAFLISDQGIHFRSQALARLAQETGFVHIPIYRHRPQSNGIAERFVLTLKQALRQRSWSGPQELTERVAEIRPAYNDRPHQGLPIPGLSPNEPPNWLRRKIGRGNAGSSK
jgi:transposase InsO family protein